MRDLLNQTNISGFYKGYFHFACKFMRPQTSLWSLMTPTKSIININTKTSTVFLKRDEHNTPNAERNSTGNCPKLMAALFPISAESVVISTEVSASPLGQLQIQMRLSVEKN